MNHLKANKATHLAVGAFLASAVTAFFAGGINMGVITPHWAPIDPVALTLGRLDLPTAAQTGA